MQKSSEIRWQQRLINYEKAFSQLNAAVNLAKQRKLSELETQGLIQAFEFTHELAWNLMKDYFFFQGNTNIMGSRDAIRESFDKGLIEEGESWMETIMSRNQSTHTYNLKVANEIAEKIIHQYSEIFSHFLKKMQSLVNKL